MCQHNTTQRLHQTKQRDEENCCCVKSDHDREQSLRIRGRSIANKYPCSPVLRVAKFQTDCGTVSCIGHQIHGFLICFVIDSGKNYLFLIILHISTVYVRKFTTIPVVLHTIPVVLHIIPHISKRKISNAEAEGTH
jgi:hypothetical protein